MSILTLTLIHGRRHDKERHESLESERFDRKCKGCGKELKLIKRTQNRRFCGDECKKQNMKNWNGSAYK